VSAWTSAFGGRAAPVGPALSGCSASSKRALQTARWSLPGIVLHLKSLPAKTLKQSHHSHEKIHLEQCSSADLQQLQLAR